MIRPRLRLYIVGLIVTSLFGWLEWGTDQSMFLFEGEWEIMSRLFTDPRSVAHPFTLLPLAGQLMLLIALSQNNLRGWFIYPGILSLALLLGFMAVIGIIGLNWRILFSTLPFLTLAVLTVREVQAE